VDELNWKCQCSSAYKLLLPLKDDIHVSRVQSFQVVGLELLSELVCFHFGQFVIALQFFISTSTWRKDIIFLESFGQRKKLICVNQEKGLIEKFKWNWNCTYFWYILIEHLAHTPLSFHQSCLSSSSILSASSVSWTKSLLGSYCDSRTAAMNSIQLFILPSLMRKGRSFIWLHFKKILAINLIITNWCGLPLSLIMPTIIFSSVGKKWVAIFSNMPLLSSSCMNARVSSLRHLNPTIWTV